MPDSRDPHQDPRHNAAWQAAQQWRERARQRNAGGLLGGVKMLLAWLLFGAMMIVALVLGLFFLLLGWALLPLLRYRMKKRMDQMRADRAEDIGGDFHDQARGYGARPEPRGDRQVLEGDYEVKSDEPNPRP